MLARKVTLIVVVAVAPIRAQDLPVDHGQWPPEVFSSAYKLIASEEEQTHLDTLQGVARAQFLERFWKLRDPTPTTPENAFRDQFRERVTYALIWFKTVNIQDPWDDRGRVYIKFGEPDERQDTVDHWYAPMDTARVRRESPKSARIKSPSEIPDPNWSKREFGEVWYYYGRNLVLQFQGEHLDYRMVPYVNGRGTYQPNFAFEESRYEVDSGQVVYVPPPEREELSLALAWYPFRREDGSYDVYFASALPISGLASSVGFKQYEYSYSAALSVFDEQLSRVWLDSASAQGSLDRQSRKHTSLSGFSHVLPPGYYLVGAEVTSADSARHASASLAGWLVPYADQVELDLSPLVVAAAIESDSTSASFFVRNEQAIWPVPAAHFDEHHPVYFYHEVYNLGTARDQQCEYRIRYTLYDRKRGTTKLLMDRELRSDRRNTFHSGSIPPGTLDGGKYILEAKIDDLVSGQSKIALASISVD